VNAFEHLERELRAGVRRAHGSTEPRRPWWRPGALVVIGALLVAAAALAATGTIRIGHTHPEEPGFRPRPHVFAGVRAGPANTLPLHVTDPAGGPSWTLRVFDSSRGGHCVQIGQVVRGHFGVFVPPGTLEPLHAWPGGTSSLCSGVARNGFPVVRGLERILIIGGEGDARRCPSRPHGDCPITSVTLLRYGLLGPGARRVRLVDESGATLASARTSARIGGAYLFAIAQPTAPYVASDRSQREGEALFGQALRAARARGESLDAAMRDAHARLPRATFVRPPDVAVLATFADGKSLRVAGHHRSPGRLPGLGPAHHAPQPPLPHDIPVAVRIADPGRFAVVTLSFTAPRAITRFDISYTQTLRGPIGTSCTVSGGNGYNATTRDIATGETVRFTVQHPPHASENGRVGWCRGHFTGRIRYSVSGRHTTIGRFAFTIRW
jgi:hypothetical protein